MDKIGKMREILQNKKGWIRIVEAFLAVLLIAAVVMTVNSGMKKKSNDDLYRIEDGILDELVKSESLRVEILNNIDSGSREFISVRLPTSLNFTIKICEPQDICNLPEYKEGVYARERIVSASLDKYSPKKVKLFAWQE